LVLSVLNINMQVQVTRFASGNNPHTFESDLITVFDTRRHFDNKVFNLTVSPVRKRLFSTGLGLSPGNIDINMIIQVAARSSIGLNASQVFRDELEKAVYHSAQQSFQPVRFTYRYAGTAVCGSHVAVDAAGAGKEAETDIATGEIHAVKKVTIESEPGAREHAVHFLIHSGVVKNTAEDILLRISETGRAGTLLYATEGRFTRYVILASFSTVTQHTVGFVNLFKPGFGLFLIAGIGVRMIFKSEFTESFFNICFGAVFGQSKYIVIIFHKSE
jgi:hypothetical protein